MALTSHLGQLYAAEPVGDAAEAAAGVDLGKLPVVADEHKLRAGFGGVRRQLGQHAGADHPRLVDDDDRPRVEQPAAFKLAPESRDGGRVDAGLIFKLARRPRTARSR